MPLESGMYAASREKRVTAWPKPDADGDGEELWQDRTLGDGTVVGRDRVKDAQGRTVRRYKVPDGFRNVGGYDGSENYVRVRENGEVFRNLKGEAVGIREGCVLVEHADGSTELLEGDYAQYTFELAHERTGEPTDTQSDAYANDAEDSRRKEAEIAEYERKLAELRGPDSNRPAPDEEPEE